jgi:hypothetical protein
MVYMHFLCGWYRMSNFCLRVNFVAKDSKLILNWRSTWISIHRRITLYLTSASKLFSNHCYSKLHCLTCLVLNSSENSTRILNFKIFRQLMRILIFPSRYCDSRFPDKAQQITHSNTLHANEGEYVCHICGKKVNC